MRSLLVACSLSLCMGLGVSHTELYAQPNDHRDARDTFQASFYNGWSIDAFAADDLARYLNAAESGEIRWHYVAGFDFSYRILGASESGQQLWIYGETVHGVRSEDVDCKADEALPVCQQSPFNPTGAPERTLYVLRNATSLEAFVGLRVELIAVQQGTKDVARLYATGQLGFLSVDGGGGDVAASHHVGLGLTAVAGRFKGSHFEVGFGRTDLFNINPGRRFKVDGFLSWRVEGLHDLGIYPFTQLTVDADLGNGADSIQSYLGIDLDLSRLLGANVT